MDGLAYSAVFFPTGGYNINTSYINTDNARKKRSVFIQFTYENGGRIPFEGSAQQQHFEEIGFDSDYISDTRG